MALHDDRLFPAEPAQRAIARRLFAPIEKLPIVSPHGHTDPAWYATDAAFPDPATLLIKPDHYIFRMLYSQGIPLERIGVKRKDGGPVETDGRTIWRLFAANWHLFRGTPSQIWMEHTLETVFGLADPLTTKNADHFYDVMSEKIASPALRPRALYEAFNIEVIATTDSALDDLAHHDVIRKSGWKGRVVPTYRPDNVVDPEFEGFHANIVKLGQLTGEDVMTWRGYLAAHRKRRAFFKARGATASDHGHARATTANLSETEAANLFSKWCAGM